MLFKLVLYESQHITLYFMLMKTDLRSVTHAVHYRPGLSLTKPPHLYHCYCKV